MKKLTAVSAEKLETAETIKLLKNRENFLALVEATLIDMNISDISSLNETDQNLFFLKIGKRYASNITPKPIKHVYENLHARELAKDIVGDGKEPNQFFVTTTNDYMYWDKSEKIENWYSANMEMAPLKIKEKIEVDTDGPYDTYERALEVAKNTFLDEKKGPRTVVVEDRLHGQLYERYMIAKDTIIWKEEIVDDSRLLKDK